jgi:ribonucleotide reductase alpha subunit
MLFVKDTATTRDVNNPQIYARRNGIQTLYYILRRQIALKGTEVGAASLLRIECA